MLKTFSREQAHNTLAQDLAHHTPIALGIPVTTGGFHLGARNPERHHVENGDAEFDLRDQEQTAAMCFHRVLDLDLCHDACAASHDELASMSAFILHLQPISCISLAFAFPFSFAFAIFPVTTGVESLRAQDPGQLLCEGFVGTTDHQDGRGLIPEVRCHIRDCCVFAHVDVDAGNATDNP